MFSFFTRSSSAVSTMTACRTVTVNTPKVEALEERKLFALGGGLQFQAEHVFDHAFADLVKASSGFKNLSGGNATTDTNGWPTQDFTVPLWADSKVDSGRYNISFNGPSNTVVSLHRGSGVLQKRADGSNSLRNWTLDVPTSSTSSTLSLKFTGTSGQVKNLKVLQPNTTAGTFWAPKYVKHLASLRPHTLRMMDIVNMNHNKTSTWAERPKSTDATFARAGAPWENLIDLSNQMGSNIWVTIPIRATDEYVKQLAGLLKSRFRSDRIIYVELSNEVWSTITDPGKFNLDQAKAEVASDPNSNLDYDGSTDPEKWAERRYARRMTQIAAIFKTVWQTTFGGTTVQPNPLNNRVRVILGGQATRLERFDNMLTYVKRHYGSPIGYFYGGGLAWYFSLNKYSDRFNPPTNLTKEQVLEGMDLSVSAYEDERRFASAVQHLAPWGLKTEAYELGVDTFGSKNIQAKKEASLDPRISGLMQRFYNAFMDQGGDAAIWFRLGAGSFDTGSGTWSITNNINDLNQPKEQGFRILRGLAPTV